MRQDTAVEVYAPDGSLSCHVDYSALRWVDACRAYGHMAAVFPHVRLLGAVDLNGNRPVLSESNNPKRGTPRTDQLRTRGRGTLEL